MRGMGAPSVEVSPSISFRRGPSTKRGLSPPPMIALSIAAPARPPSTRPAMAPNGPAMAPPIAEPTVCRTSVAMGTSEQGKRRKREDAGKMTLPPGAERHLGHAGAVMGVDHRVGGGRDGAVLRGKAVAPAEQQDMTG